MWHWPSLFRKEKCALFERINCVKPPEASRDSVTDALSKLRGLPERWRRAIEDRIVKSGDYHAGDGPESVPDCADELEALLPELEQEHDAGIKLRELAWLIDRRDRGAIEYLTGDATGFFPDWTADSWVAIRFVHRVDAERIAGIFDDLDIHVCEHQWR